MEKITITEIRRACILHVLLDGKKHSTQDIIKKTKEIQDYYGIQLDKEKKIDELISPIIKNLVNQKIIERGIKERSGRGPPTENVYKLVDSLNAFKRVVKIFGSLYYYENYVVLSLKYSLDLIISPYAKKHVNIQLIEWVESEIDAILTEDEKEYLLNLLQIFPNALYSTIILPETMNEFFSKFPDSNLNQFNKKDFYFSELIKALEFDACNPLLALAIEFEYKHSFRLIIDARESRGYIPSKEEMDGNIMAKRAFYGFDIKGIPFSDKAKKDRTYLNVIKREIGIKCIHSILNRE